jgi:multiple sugar transport system permease protein
MGRNEQVATGEGFAAYRDRIRGSEINWAIAFAIPYAAVYLALALYPIGYGLRMGHEPSLYARLFSDPRYMQAVVNTMLYVGLGVNVKSIRALLLSGFFMRER